MTSHNAFDRDIQHTAEWHPPHRTDVTTLLAEARALQQQAIADGLRTLGSAIKTTVLRWVGALSQGASEPKGSTR